jgi:hypothetical protein
VKIIKKCLSSESTLTHIDSNTNQPKQVDVSGKRLSPQRVACASGHIKLNSNAFDVLVQNKLKKGYLADFLRYLYTSKNEKSHIYSQRQCFDCRSSRRYTSE